MTAWIWTMVALLAIDTLAKLWGLAFGLFPQRTAAGTTIDVLVTAGMLIWLAAVWK